MKRFCLLAGSVLAACYIYIMVNRTGRLYIGVTNDLSAAFTNTSVGWCQALPANTSWALVYLMEGAS